MQCMHSVKTAHCRMSCVGMAAKVYSVFVQGLNTQIEVAVSCRKLDLYSN